MAENSKLKIGDKVTHKADVGVLDPWSKNKGVRKTVGLVVEVDVRECYANIQIFYLIRWTHYEGIKTAAIAGALMNHAESELDLYVEPEEENDGK